MLDSEAAMVRFLNLWPPNRDFKVPVMLIHPNGCDPKRLKCLQRQGRSTSISLKGGEEEFIRRPIGRRYGRYGGDAFDEQGQPIRIRTNRTFVKSV